jgi:hypothetical protein
MPRSNLLDAIRATEEQSTKTPKKKNPGPTPKIDADGRRVMKSRNTRRGDLRTEDERQADLAALYSNLDDDPSVQDVAYDDPALVKLRSLLPHVPEWELRGALMPQTVYEQPAPEAEPAAEPAPVTDTAKAPEPALPEPPAEAVGEWTRHGLQILSEPFKIRGITYRIAANALEYLLQQQLGRGRWVEESRSYDIGGLALHFAFRCIPAQAFHEVAATLPRHRPARQAQIDARGAQSSKKPLTGEAREHRNAEIREAVAEQRARWARTMPTGPSMLNWIDL